MRTSFEEVLTLLADLHRDRNRHYLPWEPGVNIQRRMGMVWSPFVAGVGLLLVLTACTERAPVPSGAPGPSTSMGSQAQGSAAKRGYVLRPVVARAADAAVQARVEACVGLPGVTGSTTQESSPPVYGVTVDGSRAAARFENCMRDAGFYTTEVDNSPASGDLTLAQMQALRDRINTEQDALEDRGVVLAHWGPDASRRLVTVGVEGDLAEATRVLRQEYGTDVYVTVARRPVSRG